MSTNETNYIAHFFRQVNNVSTPGQIIRESHAKRFKTFYNYHFEIVLAIVGGVRKICFAGETKPGLSFANV